MTTARRRPLTVAVASPWLEAREARSPRLAVPPTVALAGINRPIFNGSVVAGGVDSADELRAAIERDPVVAHHYRGADLDEMRAVTLTAGRAAYVSYRDGIACTGLADASARKAQR